MSRYDELRDDRLAFRQKDKVSEFPQLAAVFGNHPLALKFRKIEHDLFIVLFTAEVN
jgi:hypothetical protein